MANAGTVNNELLTSVIFRYIFYVFVSLFIFFIPSLFNTYTYTSYIFSHFFSLSVALFFYLIVSLPFIVFSTVFLSYLSFPLSLSLRVCVYLQYPPFLCNTRVVWCYKSNVVYRNSAFPPSIYPYTLFAGFSPVTLRLFQPRFNRGAKFPRSHYDPLQYRSPWGVYKAK